MDRQDAPDLQALTDLPGEQMAPETVPAPSIRKAPWFGRPLSRSKEGTVGTEETPRPANSFRDYLRSMGPGLVVAFMWLGTGDLIDAAVAGATYGYALIWGLALALLCRYFYVSNISKYVLCNAMGDDGILAGFARLWRFFPVIIGVAGLALGATYISYLLKAAGVALSYLTGEFAGQAVSQFLWAAVLSGVSVWLVLSKRQYSLMENIAKFSAVLLLLTFIAAVVMQGADLVALVKGLSFGVPKDEGAFGAMLVVVALIGAVGGSAANLLYPYFMAEKGWKGPGFRKMQRYDLLTGIASIIVINLSVWIVAAEAFGGSQRSIGAPEDLADMMEIAVGSFGPTILWVGLFFVAFSSVPAYAMSFTRLMVDGFHKSFPSRAERYTLKTDPISRRMMVIVLVVPLIFSLPFAPNVVVLTVIGSGFAVLSAPIIITGVIMLTSRKKYMLPGFANRWWETLIMAAIGAVGIWAIYHLISALAQLIT